MTARIRVEIGDSPPMIVELVKERTLLGRAPDSDVQLDDVAVSADHLEITRHGGCLLAMDLGSRNGTLLNGRRIVRPERLTDGDTLTLGRCRLTVSVSRPAGAIETTLSPGAELTLTSEELAVASALVAQFRRRGALAPRPASRAEIAQAAHLSERTVTRRLESLSIKLMLAPHDPRERSRLLAERVLQLGLDRQRV